MHLKLMFFKSTLCTFKRHTRFKFEGKKMVDGMVEHATLPYITSETTNLIFTQYNRRRTHIHTYISPTSIFGRIE